MIYQLQSWRSAPRTFSLYELQLIYTVAKVPKLTATLFGQQIVLDSAGWPTLTYVFLLMHYAEFNCYLNHLFPTVWHGLYVFWQHTIHWNVYSFQVYINGSCYIGAHISQWQWKVMESIVWVDISSARGSRERFQRPKFDFTRFWFLHSHSAIGTGYLSLVLQIW